MRTGLDRGRRQAGGPHLAARRQLAGRSCLVTGASSGIGRATAIALANAGATVALAGRDEQRLVEAAAETAAAAGHAGAAEQASSGGTSSGGTSSGGKGGEWGHLVHSYSCDLCVPGEAARLVASCEESMGPLHIVVANAGAGWTGNLWDMPAESANDLCRLNLASTIELLIEASGRMAERGFGRIVVVGSVAGGLDVPRESAYASTKAGVARLAGSLRLELAGHGVSVSHVAPGPVDTAFVERRGQPYTRRHPKAIPAERVAAAILLAASTGRPELVVPAWFRLPMLVQSLAPSIYRALAARVA
ncbi:MAG: SDR family NAD(P)-dependent oxidoreductase [Acidimicrobiales bacterium]